MNQWSYVQYIDLQIPPYNTLKNHRRKDKVGINTLHSSGQTYTDDKAKADVLNNHFSSVFTRENILILKVTMYQIFHH